MGEAGKGLGDGGYFFCPVEGFDKQGDQEADTEKDKQARERPAQVLPKMGQGEICKHACDCRENVDENGCE
mgnify:CR=1 FL=1